MPLPISAQFDSHRAERILSSPPGPVQIMAPGVPISGPQHISSSQRVTATSFLMDQFHLAQESHANLLPPLHVPNTHVPPDDAAYFANLEIQHGDVPYGGPPPELVRCSRRQKWFPPSSETMFVILYGNPILYQMLTPLLQTSQVNHVILWHNLLIIISFLFHIKYF